MKIAMVLIALYVFMGTMMLFDASMSMDSVNLEPYNVTIMDNVSGEELNYTQNTTSQGAFWGVFWNPTQLQNNGFLNLLANILFVATIAAVAVTVLTKSDITLLTPGFIALVSAGTFPIIALWQMIYREAGIWCVRTGDCCSSAQIEAREVLNGVVCSTNSTCTPAIWITGIIIGPLAVIFILACMEWLTARPMT